MNRFKLLGILIISFGLVINRYSLRYVSNYELKIDSLEKEIFIILFEFAIILTGFYVLRKGKKALQNLLLLSFTIIVFLTITEFSLIYIFPADLKMNSPLWIPHHKFVEKDIEINKKHEVASQKNKYRFNDINHTYNKKNPETYRIVVLGDSFIWGHGVEDSTIWSRKLEKLLREKNKNIEVFHWGRNGMSTQDQLKFLREEGTKYEYDLLILGFVVNDPDLERVPIKHLVYYHGTMADWLRNSIFYPFKNTFDFLNGVTNNFANQYFGYGYVNWLEEHLYSDHNLSKYSKIISALKLFLTQQNTPFLFVMTPENHNLLLGKYFSKITPIYEKYRIKYFNLFPLLEEEFKNYYYWELGASPLNGHPGDMVTEFYANCVYEYLLENNYFF